MSNFVPEDPEVLEFQERLAEEYREDPIRVQAAIAQEAADQAMGSIKPAIDATLAFYRDQRFVENQKRGISLMDEAYPVRHTQGGEGHHVEDHGWRSYAKQMDAWLAERPHLLEYAFETADKAKETFEIALRAVREKADREFDAAAWDRVKETKPADYAASRVGR